MPARKDYALRFGDDILIEKDYNTIKLADCANATGHGKLNESVEKARKFLKGDEAESVLMEKHGLLRKSTL